jgi:hypothetical protein
MPAGAVALVAVIGAGLAIALGASGSSTIVTTTTTTTPGVTSSTATTASTTTTPPATTSMSSATPPTTTQIYSPANASGGLAVSVSRRANGSCFTTSNVTTRTDAYRCTVGNNLYDPCFSVNQSQVLCPLDGPWANHGLLMDVSSLPSTPGGSQDQGTNGQPWAIQLSGGTNCMSISGATSLIAGQRLGYDCTGGVGLYGNVQRSGPVWMIFVGTPHSSTLAPKPIMVAWF